MANQVTPIVIKLKNVRLSFPSLDKPTAPKNADDPSNKKFRGTFILDPNNREHRRKIKEIEAEADRLVKEAFSGKRIKEIPRSETYGDGNDALNRDGEVYDGYENMFFIKALNDKRPRCLTRGKEDVDVEDVASTFYAGCRVNASINLWIQDNDFGRGVRCSLRGVQFYEDDEEFGGSVVDVDKEFDDFDDDDYDDDDDLI